MQPRVAWEKPKIFVLNPIGKRYNESQFADADLAPLHNLVAAIIRLENTRSFDNEKALAQANKKALLEISDDLIVQDDGTFKVKINDEWKTYRVSLSSEPVNSEQALGLFDNPDGSIRLVFEEDIGQKRQQLIRLRRREQKHKKIFRVVR